MKTAIKTVIAVSFTVFILFSIFTEPNYSFWLTVAVYIMSWVLASKDDNS